MERTLQISIECSETTCASPNGGFCEWLGIRMHRPKFFCGLFNIRLTQEGNPRGWPKRCIECRKHETNSVQTEYSVEISGESLSVSSAVEAELLAMRARTGEN